jgi:hypothetical protein
VNWKGLGRKWLFLAGFFFSVKKKWGGKKTCKNVKWLKGAKLVDFEGALLTRQVHTKRRTETEEFIKEQAWTAGECDQFHH